MIETNAVSSPIVQPISPVAPKGGLERFLRYPIKAGELSGFVSAREKFVCDVLLSTAGNIAVASKETEARFKRPISRETIKYWMTRKPLIQAYLKKVMNISVEYNSFTPEEYKIKIRHLAEGDVKVNRSTVAFWKLVGEAHGWLKDARESSDTNITIDLRQADGSL
jgi:hypothetical protein